MVFTEPISLVKHLLCAEPYVSSCLEWDYMKKHRIGPAFSELKVGCYESKLYPCEPVRKSGVKVGQWDEGVQEIAHMDGKGRGKAIMAQE